MLDSRQFEAGTLVLGQGSLLWRSKFINFLDVGCVRNTVPVPIVHAKIGSFAVGIESRLRYHRFVYQAHGKEVFHSVSTVRD
jgi:hypothetical protein